MHIITGASRGIGRALALELARCEKEVLIIGRNEEQLKETQQLNSNITYLALDISLPESWEKIRNFTPEKIDTLINNAGILGTFAPVTKIEYADWQKTIATNVTPALFLTSILFNKLHAGKVLNIGSGAAYFPIKGWTNYCVSKAALSMLTRCWQIETDSVAVASVQPGIIDTDMQTVIRHAKHMDADKLEFFTSLHKNKKLISPETVAKFLCWLLLELNNQEYVSQEWDIYDTSHHKYWLPKDMIIPAID